MAHKFAIKTLNEVCRFLLRLYAQIVIPFPTVPNINTDIPTSNPKYRIFPEIPNVKFEIKILLFFLANETKL